MLNTVGIIGDRCGFSGLWYPRWLPGRRCRIARITAAANTLAGLER
jgi:hypothetical protein